MKTGTLFHELRELLNTGELAALGPVRRASAFQIPEIDARLKTAFADSRLSPAVQDLFRAAVYLWHDHLEPAHRIVQEIETADGSLIHAIMHRREPDYGNSKYWYRRAGSHPSFLGLALKASEYLEKAEQSDLHSRLVPNKTWDPFAFVDAVEDVMDGQFPSQIPVLEHVQKMEFESLLENLANRV